MEIPQQGISQEDFYSQLRMIQENENQKITTLPWDSRVSYSAPLGEQLMSVREEYLRLQAKISGKVMSSSGKYYVVGTRKGGILEVKVPWLRKTPSTDKEPGSIEHWAFLGAILPPPERTQEIGMKASLMELLSLVQECLLEDTRIRGCVIHCLQDEMKELANVPGMQQGPSEDLLLFPVSSM